MKNLMIILAMSFFISSIAYGFGERSSIAFRYGGEQELRHQIANDVYRTYYEDRMIVTTCYNPYPYPCRRIVRVPVNVLDHRVESFVTLLFNESSESVVGDYFRLFYSPEGREQLVYVGDEHNEDVLALGKVIDFSNQQVGPRIFRHNITVTMKFKDELERRLSPIMRPLKDVITEDRMLSFTSSKIFSLDNYFVHLKIEKNGRFSDKTIYNATVPKAYLELSPFGADKTLVLIDLENLTDEIEYGKKYKIYITAGLDYNGYIILNERYSNIPLIRKAKIKSKL